MKPVTIILLAIAAAASTQAKAEVSQPFTVAETGKSYAALGQAVKAIGSGNGTIVIRPGTYRQCAVQEAGNISFKAAIPGQVIFDRTTCDNKAALVLRGKSAVVDGIIFQGMAVPDANGAGIRLEKGNLKVTRSIFRDSEQGILTGNDKAGAISIDQTTFSGLGRCDRGLSCAHSIYIGHYGALTVTRSRFEKGRGGHYIKCRSGRATIKNNAFDDSKGSGTTYMIDLSGGASGSISGNIFLQGASKNNGSAFITIAPEGRVYSSKGLTIANNDARLATGVRRSVAFVANWTEDQINLGANRLGRGLRPYERR